MKGIKNRLKVDPNLNKVLLIEHNTIEKQQKEQQQEFYGLVALPAENEPSYNNLQQGIFRQNVGMFTTLLESWTKGNHCYNDITQFQNVPVLSEGWCIGWQHKDWMFKGFTPTRDLKLDSQSKLRKFEALFSVVDFCREAPILFDKEWRIIDGYHRYYAICHLPRHLYKKFYFKQLDF